jgi:hypothetical protein
MMEREGDERKEGGRRRKEDVLSGKDEAGRAESGMKGMEVPFKGTGCWT